MSWEPLIVELGGEKHGPQDGDETKNHYDNTKLSKKALKDLPANPGEEIGMFYGLEVCRDFDVKLLKNSNTKAVETKQSKEHDKESSEPKKKKRKAPPEESEASKDTTTSKKKTKRKKKKKANAEPSPPVEEESLDDDETGESSIDEDRFLELQQAWGNVLDSRLETGLYRQGFVKPTPVQAAALHPAILGRRNIVGAAPTGSGKTLAFLLPILQHILREDLAPGTPPQAVIVTPTRELATQIHHECNKLAPDTCMTLVGGIALVKQARILATKRPPIIIGTPGRLWAVISSQEHEHLNDLSQIRFLVLDEADRMTQDHCFPQMLSILEAINEANLSPGSDDESDSSDDEDDADDGRMSSLPGVRGEAKVTLLTDDLLQQIEEQRASTQPGRFEVPDDEFPNNRDGEEEEKGVHRQTFIFSATLTLPFTSLSEKTKRRRTKHGLDGGIADILDRTNSMGETKVIDLTSSKTESGSPSEFGLRLPPGLVLEQIKCTQMHKDSHLYAYLTTTAQGSSGPCLIFCNSIAAVRRVGKTLELLRFSVRILHAHMQQRARFKAVESLADSGKRTVVVCTDIAARGLDIPSVATVVHYDVARSVDGFVHRSGRTARGIGEGATGTSLSLVSPAEDKSHSKIVEALQVSFSKVMLDGRLMTGAQERTNLASKIVKASELEQNMNSNNNWFVNAAKEADIEIDDDLVEDESNMALKDQLLIKEAKRAKVLLQPLLSEPMKTQRFGKFLSTNSAVMQTQIAPLAIKDTKASTQKKKSKIKGKGKKKGKK
ncbi:unnamed protein product [Cylindrotheca closterium]|uniref:ATP-dependent RNA helicase n=1 Tax=Cylindrotheca closterium TaxID=2856 RepID=A0AAD2CHU0_9STRA|nr:unnamed protein product [Cylindrotheca closterium]